MNLFGRARLWLLVALGLFTANAATPDRFVESPARTVPLMDKVVIDATYVGAVADAATDLAAAQPGRGAAARRLRPLRW